MHYRAEIDGLRALAIIPVVLFHAGFSVMTGGFIGVDVFFVISGFLITSIIVTEMNTGAFSLSRFYERRARRILPALFLLFVISIVLSYFVLLPHQIKDLSQSIVAASAFLSNVFFYLKTDYFNEFTNKAPLLHTWTLSVEEQFYIVFPILLMIFHRFGKVVLNSLIGILFATSLFFSVITVGENPTLAFYATHTRAWELMAGCIVAINKDGVTSFISRLAPEKQVRTLYEYAGLASLFGILYSLFHFSSKTPHPSWITLIPVASTAVLLLVGDRTHLVQKMLSNRVLVSIGLLSYSLYIFHQPIISLLHYSGLGRSYSSSPLYTPLLIVLIVSVSCASYFYFEKPIRYNRKVSATTVFMSSGAFLFAFAVAGYIGHEYKGFQSHFADKFKNTGGVLLVDADNEKSVVSAFAESAYSTNHLTYSPRSDVRILILGDSMARDAYLSLYKYKSDLSSEAFDVKVLEVDDECMSTFKSELIKSDGFTSCLKNQAIENIKKKIDSSTIILITAKWQETTFSQGYDLAKYLSETSHARVYIFDSIMFQDITSLSMDFARSGVTPESSKKIMYDNIRFDRLTTSDKLHSLVRNEHALTWVEKRGFFCDSMEKTCTLFDQEGLPLIWDGVHLTHRAYRRYAEFMLDKVGVNSL